MQIADILRRNKESEKTPRKFNIWFFLKDTYQKIILSLALSIFISLIVKLNLSDVHTAFSGDSLYGELVYVVIGAVPEYVLQRVKKKFGFAQPEQVNQGGQTFKRKN